MKSGIYSIQHAQSGKRYIGSAVDWKKRLNHHLNSLKRGNHANSKLQHAWNKYGESNFLFNLLIVCDKSDLLFFEQRALDAYDAVKAGYNICSKADNVLGIKRSLETRARMSAAARGTSHSPETRQKLSDLKSGGVLTSDHRWKIGESLKGRSRPQEVCAKISAAKKGCRISESTRNAVSESNRRRAKNSTTTEGQCLHY